MNRAPSLCPGYKQVTSFGPDDDYEKDSEEVAYVTLDLGSIEPTLVPSSTTYRLIGLDSPTPFLQLSGTILKGRHETLLGTELIFTDGKDPSDSTKRAVTHVASTEQRICFREVRLQPKGTAAPTSPTRSKGKGKGWDDEATRVLEAEMAAASQMVDRVTGKNVPRTRAPRTSRGNEASGSGTAKRQTKSRKGKDKGKGKEKARQEDEEMIMGDADESGGEDKNMDVDMFEG